METILIQRCAMLFQRYFNVRHWRCINVVQLVSEICICNDLGRYFAQDTGANWTHIRRSDVFWTSYARSIYVVCPGAKQKVQFVFKKNKLKTSKRFLSSNILLARQISHFLPTKNLLKHIFAWNKKTFSWNNH